MQFASAFRRDELLSQVLSNLTTDSLHLDGEDMSTTKQLNRGDVVTCNRFRFGYTRPQDGRVQVGCIGAVADSDDPTRATARYLVVHIATNKPGDEGRPFREVTALRLDDCRLTDEIVIETLAVCHEKIAPERIEMLEHFDSPPVLANGGLVVVAASKDEAAAIAASVLGFVPTEEPRRNGGTWIIDGHKYREVTHEKVLGVCELITADASPIDVAD